MKMIRGSSGATIADYGSYSSNCTLGQKPYKIPVNSLSDVQLYAEIGGQPDTIQYQLIHTCGGGGIETIIPGSYVAGQDTNDRWYGVFKNFTGASPICFVIAITVDYGGTERIFFSEEYCVETNCGQSLDLIKGCYGNLDNLISYNCQGIYFGVHAGEETALGDTTLTYKHQLFLRGVEVTLSNIKNTFKQGRTRNFRTEKEKIYQFFAELVPEWYIPEVDAVFYRGEVYVGDTKYLVNETAFEKVEECKKQWKPTATFKDSCFQSFSCEADPCGPPAEEESVIESGTESPGSGESPAVTGPGRVENRFPITDNGRINSVSFNGPVQYVDGIDFPLFETEEGEFEIMEVDFGTSNMIVGCTGSVTQPAQVFVRDSMGTLQTQVWTGTGSYVFPGVIINSGAWLAGIEPTS